MTGDRPAAIVTGAGTGVGAACARLLARRGYNVLVNYARSKESAEEVARGCSADGADAIAVQGSVAEDETCRRLAQSALDRWGQLDALVNCAGTTQFVPMHDLDGLNADDFQRVYAVNVVGAYQMARAFARDAREGGAIVNVSSVGGVYGTGSSYAYAASKGALNTLTLALARNLAPRIRVNAVVPGMIQGRWLREGLGNDAYELTKTAFERQSALGHVCTPAEVAGAIIWLLADATFITGQLITVDAGLTLGRPPQVLK